MAKNPQEQDEHGTDPEEIRQSAYIEVERKKKKNRRNDAEDGSGRYWDSIVLAIILLPIEI